MSNLSALQITTLQTFREAHPGPVGVILEDDQGYFSLIRHLTQKPVHDWDHLADLKRRMVVGWFNGGGNGRPDQVNLREEIRSYRWCFVLFQTTLGRDDIAAQLDALLEEGQQLDRLVLVNYHLDQSEAKDNLRRLFGMIPTVELYFADAQHLFDIGADKYVNPRGARQVTKLFEHLRKVGLPLFAVSYREFRRSVEALGSKDDSEAVTTAVRERLTRVTEAGFKLKAPWLPPRQEFWDRVDRAFKAFLAEEESK